MKDQLRMALFFIRRNDNMTSQNLATPEEIIACQLVSCCRCRAGRRVEIIMIQVGLRLPKKKTEIAGMTI